MNCKGLGAALLKNVLDSRSSEREKREMETNDRQGTNALFAHVRYVSEMSTLIVASQTC